MEQETVKSVEQEPKEKKRERKKLAKIKRERERKKVGTNEMDEMKSKENERT